MSKLDESLGDFLPDRTLAGRLAQALNSASGKGYVSYEEIEREAAGDAEDVLLLGFGWRLLLPVRTKRCAEWDDRILLAEPGEIYELPNIVKWLVDDASKTGKWNPERALTDLFRTMREPAWKQIPILVEQLMERSQNHRISAIQIKETCEGLGLGDRVDGLIAELKGSGVMSPQLRPMTDLAKTQEGPLYELNPCLFILAKQE
ncbi:MAG: hypothetical protein WC749_09255 [Dehalococcoidia bacterium]